MALETGSVQANSGMSQAIYREIDGQLSPPLQQAVNNAQGEARTKAQEALDEARQGWKKLSYAIAKGVIEHIISNIEIRGVRTRGDVSTTVKGSTGAAGPGPHSHTVGLSGKQTGVVLTQSNDGTGLVK